MSITYYCGVDFHTNKVHPEQKAGELFIGNTASLDFCNWKSKRLGEIAFAIDGTVAPKSWPLFASANEVVNGIDNFWDTDLFKDQVVKKFPVNREAELRHYLKCCADCSCEELLQPCEACSNSR